MIEPGCRDHVEGGKETDFIVGTRDNKRDMVPTYPFRLRHKVCTDRAMLIKDSGRPASTDLVSEKEN